MEFIRTYRKRFGVEPICETLTAHGIAIAPSTFYAHQARGFGPSEAELDEAYHAHRIFRLWEGNRKVYGRRKLWKTAIRDGMTIGRDQVERLMKITGIHGVSRGMHCKKTTVAHPAHRRHPDLINRRWSHPTRPDQWWIADFTYVWTSKGFCYVAFIVDAYSRMILGWVVTRMVLMALEHALFSRKRTRMGFTATGIVHHSDAGAQGGFNRSSQHLDNGGVWWRGKTGLRRPEMRPRGFVGSGGQTGRCGRRCGRLDGLLRRGWCSGSSGG
ncbi:DDE-type integrase/transposase/recombinase [Corynebacterium sp. L4756]|uniref:DDE-type integrase/transposase/recombinase n=1 Tax=unclassified Corynebacterium TaxID=2624378 RepID=UPI00374DBF24